jgi:signal peptidase I
MKILNWIVDFIYGKDFSKKSKKRDYFLIPLYALLIAVLFRSLLFDNYHVPSGSMKNTLLIGDKITVSMFSYGYSRYSFPFGLAPIKGRIFAKNKPERGDIMVFKLPSQTSINYVKRLIGLPNDKIKLINGELYINGEKATREFVEYVKDSEIGFQITLSKFKETLPTGKSFEILKFYQEGEGVMDNLEEFQVPEGHYFFMGDNRDFSKDSRFEEVGFVREELIVGRVERILISSPSSLLNIFDWHNIRFSRIWQKPK